MKKIVFSVIAALIFAGCATSVTFQVQRAPEMNTVGIKRIAVMPFEAGNNTDSQKDIAQFITSKVTSGILAANYYTLVDHMEIERLQKSGEKIENHVDALFTGQVISSRTSDSSHIEDRTDPQTKETYKVTVYDRTSELSFNYRLVRARDGSIIDIVTRDGKKEDKNEKRQDLKPGSQLLEEIVTGELANFTRQIAPYTTSVNRSLMNEKSKDKELKSKMKDIAAIVNKKNYKTALNNYLAIFSQYRNAAAGYNAAVMHEAQGDIRSAIEVIENVLNVTGNAKARDYLGTLNQSFREQERYTAGYTETRNQVDRIIIYAIDEIYGILPPDAKLWIFNNSKEEMSLADSVADGITSGLMRKGVTVVDRENSALVEAEQMFQMSGSVSDSDFTSIANAAGANTLVTVAISGISSLRRLQLRVLDIEKRTNLYQSDVSDNWKL